MSASVFPPTAPTTLVILLGASAWPNSPGFQPSQAFAHAAWEFKYYVLDPQGFGLSPANLLDLFDAPFSAGDQLEMLGSFLEQRTLALKAANQVVRDVVVYFVGHGGFAGSSADFYLLPRRANASSLRASGMAIDALAEVLREKARQMRRYLVLDCCFAAAAFRSFQGGPDQTAITKTLDAFQVQYKSSGFPGKGTVLLCSSDQKSPSLLLPDESSTMFSHALLDVLRSGDFHRPQRLSLRDIKELAEDRLAALPEKNAPRPSLHSPDQSEGDVADVPVFPNPSVSEARPRAEEAERTRFVPQEYGQIMMEQAFPLPGQRFPPAAAPQIALPPQSSTVLPSPLTPKGSKGRRSPSVVAVLILLILILLGGGSIGIYGAVTGNWPWSQHTSHGQSTPSSPSKTVSIAPGPKWHAHDVGTRQNLHGIARAGSVFLAVGDSSTILTSLDGNIWSPQDSPPSYDFTDVSWSGSLFVATAHFGLLTSPDGRSWTRQHTGLASYDLTGVAWSDSLSLFVAVGTDVIFTSPDGRSWALQDSVSASLYSVTWSSQLSLFVAVGESGTILTSPDGKTWTAQNAGTSRELNAVTWSGSLFVVVGGNSLNTRTILTSPDGKTWTAQNAGTSHYLYGVTWSGSLFAAVGVNGTILTSPDGKTWTAQNAGTSNNLWSVAGSGSFFVAVGDSGTVLTSP